MSVRGSEGTGGAERGAGGVLGGGREEGREGVTEGLDKEKRV